MHETFHDLFYRYSTYYIHHNGKSKFDSIKSKIYSSSRVSTLINESSQRRIAPNEVDFATCINSITYFIFSGSETTAMGEFIAMDMWYDRVNKTYGLCSEQELFHKGNRIVDRWKLKF